MNKTELSTLLVKRTLEKDIQISKQALSLLVEQEEPIEKYNLILDSLDKKITIILPEHIKEFIQAKEPETYKVEVIRSYTQNEPIQSVLEISNYFSNRYNYFRNLLKNRLQGPVSISHAKNLTREKVSIIGIVNDKRETQKGNIIIDLEDPTGSMRAIATNKEVIKKAETIIHDETLGISGSTGKEIIFIDDIIWPDLPIKREDSKPKNESYAALLSDTHIGSKKFLKKEFSDLMEWFKGNSQINQDMLDKLKYIFVAGDIVDGVGIYPNQEAELEIKDIYAQYEEAAKFFAEVPEDIQIIMVPGNHDYVRLAQPQPPLDEEVAKPLYELSNTVMLGNPSIVKVAGTNSIGVNVLLYHGVSIDTMVATDPTLKDGYKHPEKVMRSLLMRRHLSPQYESGVISSGEDYLTIPEDIDVFHTGHVHSNGAMNYRGVTLINSGAWQSRTEYQRLCGHEPTPGQLPLLNLKTRELSLMEFVE
jgi:DNA polymerase II small subunit